MSIAQRVTRVLFLILVVLGAVAWHMPTAAADGSSRQTTIVVQYDEVEWWLLRWKDNTVLCSVIVDHDGLPTSAEVLKSCGETLLAEWHDTPPCAKIIKGNPDTTQCSGLYLNQISIQSKTREILVELPSPTVGVNLQGCTPAPPENQCSEMPALLLSAEEPLPNEHITGIEGIFNEFPFVCEGSTCALPLNVTPEAGIDVEFWAISSYGDQSERYTAKVRVVDSGVSLDPGGSGWFVDVLSTQWQGGRLASCSQTWGAFPPVGGLTTWLGTPDSTALLASDEPYYYLAGRLISQGVVDASACVTGGLLPNGYADACGLEAARPQVQEWQNRFDERIVQVAEETGVPAQLMKNLFAQESQFWPGIFRVPYEYGLGQITDKGAETLLLWDPSFFQQFCPLVLAQDACDGGYLKLGVDDQALLRGALAVEAKTDCTDCPEGVDLTTAEFSVQLFANTLLANCEQVAQVVYNATKDVPGQVASYEDLWRFTLANYHGGPGCLSYAIHTAWTDNGLELVWDEVSTKFTPACQSVIPYVDKITH
jgi:hypothetical protein